MILLEKALAWMGVEVARMGSAALLVAFLVALYASAVSLYGAFTRRTRFIRSGEAALHAVSALVTLAAAALLWAFLRHDFSLLYVFEYSSRALSTAYTIAAFWAGQDGSLLLWMWLLAVFTSVALWQNRDRERELMPWVSFVFALVASFFLLVLNFVTNPFAPYPGPVPPDGSGLNPLLQDPGMVFHPPALFLGYVGLTVPFAFAIAALITGRVDEGWHTRTRRWGIVSWFFLSLGILLGAWWAYTVLGWGGYWAWDPVENASLLPWLTITAFLHSIMIQERKGMLRVWNMILIILSFFLVIFGTFITRSGVISSVHAFGKSRLGTYFLVFMLASLAGSLALVLWRRRHLSTPEHLESYLSRESSFLLNNIIFFAMTFVVFWGTLFPVLSEMAAGRKVELGVPFYNQIMVPLGVLLFALMALCPLLGWRGASLPLLARNSLAPGAALAAAGGAAWVLGVRHPGSLLVLALSPFAALVVVREVFRGTAARRRAGESWPLALSRLMGGNKRRYGGYLIHLGMVIVFIGLAGSSMNQEYSAMVSPGGIIQAGRYQLVYEQLASFPQQEYFSVAARVRVMEGGKIAGTLHPEQRYYGNRSQEEKPRAEVATLSTWEGDLYTILNGYDVRTNQIALRVMVNPLVPWVWAGGYLLAAGTVFLLWPASAKASAGKPAFAKASASEATADEQADKLADKTADRLADRSSSGLSPGETEGGTP